MSTHYKVHDYRKQKAYQEARKSMQEYADGFEKAFNGNVRVEFRISKGAGTWFDLIPTVPLESEHLFIAFIAQAFEKVNDPAIVGESSSDPSEALKALLMSAVAGKINASPQQALAQLIKQQVAQKMDPAYKIRHLVIQDSKQQFFEAQKHSATDELSIAPKIPREFDWKTAYIRIPKD